MGEGINERGGSGVSHVEGMAGSVEGKKRKERKKRIDWVENNNIIIWSRNIDCSRKIPKNTRRYKTSS